MRLRITTWNANSIRLRADALTRIKKELDPDILCIQEIKVETAKFPHEMIDELGFEHRHIHGQKGYHGVATLSRLPFTTVDHRHWCGVEDHRHATVGLAGGLTLHNLYIPAGGDIPDIEANPKFKQKLDMLDELTAWFGAGGEHAKKSILVGDFNIAPLENDVWSHKQLLKVVSHTPVEVEALGRLQTARDYVDAVRAIVPADEKLYSWWSYRNRDWAASDRGRRLDHIWLTPDLLPKLKGASILREARGWPQPSDHVPVTVDLEV